MDHAYEVKILTIEEAERDFGSVCATIRWVVPGHLTDDQVARIASVVVGTCHGCFERSATVCHCFD